MGKCYQILTRVRIISLININREALIDADNETFMSGKRARLGGMCF